MADSAEVLFYHLDGQPLERVLPALLEKTLQRGWRAVVQASSEERVASLDQILWTYSDDSFLPHGSKGGGNIELQPVFLTDGDENPNGAGVRFMVDGARAASFEGVFRLVYVFDGADQEAVEAARSEWKSAKAAGCKVTYWQQDDDGRWQQKA